MASWKEYAKAVLHDSFVLWERGEHVAMFSGVVLTSILLGLLLLAGVGITFKPIVTLSVGFALLIWLVLLILVVSPYRIWVKVKKRSKNMKRH